MAVDGEIYFPNLVAENFKLQTLTSQETFERILNMERAFLSDKNCIKAVSVNKGFQKKKSRPKFLGSKPSGNNSTSTCGHCGYPHASENCNFKDRICNICGRKGHLKAVCWYKDSGKFQKGKEKKKEKKKLEVSLANQLEDSSDSDTDVNNLFGVKPVFSVKSELVNFTLNDVKVPFEIDTGAWVSTLSKEWVHSLKLVAEPYNKSLHAYGHTSIKVLGKVDVTVAYNSHVVDHTFCVVESGNSNLCGNDLQKKVGICLTGIDESSRVSRLNQIVDANTALNDPHPYVVLWPQYI